MEFRLFLDDPTRVCFDRAWQEYCCYQEYPDAPFLKQYITDRKEFKNTDDRRADIEEKRTLALRRMEALLKFAKPK